MPEDAYGLLMKGRALQSYGHPHQAAVVLERAAAIEPRKASIREALARALYNSGQFSRAREQFEVMLEIDPSNGYAHYGMGMCLARAGDRAAAIGHLKMAVVMSPSTTYAEALERLGG